MSSDGNRLTGHGTVEDIASDIEQIRDEADLDQFQLNFNGCGSLEPAQGPFHWFDRPYEVGAQEIRQIPTNQYSMLQKTNKAEAYGTLGTGHSLIVFPQGQILPTAILDAKAS